jgi:antibiotic biosynthesis monooxygenase (ABM) superfamily enzyme
MKLRDRLRAPPPDGGLWSSRKVSNWSRKAQRRITLNKAMSITPSTPAETARGGFKTWVNSQRKFPPFRVSSEWKSTVLRLGALRLLSYLAPPARAARRVLSHFRAFRSRNVCILAKLGVLNRNAVTILRFQRLSAILKWNSPRSGLIFV